MSQIDISSLVVFGDSLSDNGNLFKLTEGPPNLRLLRTGMVIFPTARLTPNNSPNCWACRSMIELSGVHRRRPFLRYLRHCPSTCPTKLRDTLHNCMATRQRKTRL